MRRGPRPWRPLIPPGQQARHAGRATLVLDMNHTLVSGVDSLLKKYDFASKVPGMDGTMLTLKRPYVDRFLKRMSQIFEVIAFTSCEKRLADPILNELDPKAEIFAHRLYHDSCSFHPEVGDVKDLSLLGRGLERVMIVDDSMSKCLLNLDNWIPVSRFEDDLTDRELLDLVPQLEELATMEDVRPALKERRIAWMKKSESEMF